MTPEERAARGTRYEQFIRSSEAAEALKYIEQQYMDEWARCHEREERENLWRAVQVTRKIAQHFGQMAGDGKVAQNQLTEIRRLGIKTSNGAAQPATTVL